MTTAALSVETTARQRVAEHVRNILRQQRLPVGTLLPNYHQLCLDVNVSYMSVKQGMDLLEDEGLIKRLASRGTFVARALARDARPLRHLAVVYPASINSMLGSPWNLEILKGISQVAPQDEELHIFSMRDQGLITAARLEAAAVDGAILLCLENDAFLRLFASWGIPAVVVDYAPQGVPLDYVACANAAASARVVAHLADLGHRRVGYVVTTAHNPVVDPKDVQRTILDRLPSDERERREASMVALRERGMLATEFHTSSDISPREVQVADQWQAIAERPTALLCDNNMMATSLVTELQRRGVKVPEQVSVAAVSTTQDGGWMGAPRITGCRFDFLEMGRTAAKRLEELTLHPELTDRQSTRIAFEFISGSTCQASNQ